MPGLSTSGLVITGNIGGMSLEKLQTSHVTESWCTGARTCTCKVVETSLLERMNYMWKQRRDLSIITKSMFLFTLVHLIIDPDIRSIGLSQSLVFAIPSLMLANFVQMDLD